MNPLAKSLNTATLVKLIAGVGYCLKSVAKDLNGSSIPATSESPPASTTVSTRTEIEVREKLKKTWYAMHAIAIGIEGYSVDNNRYPESNTSGRIRKPAHGEENVVSFGGPDLTTPVAYVDSYLEDPFATQAGQTFCYFVNDPGWIIFSPGPDGKFDLGWLSYDPKVTQPSNELLLNSYDPTNGIISSGDIFRVKQ